MITRLVPGTCHICSMASQSRVLAAVAKFSEVDAAVGKPPCDCAPDDVPLFQCLPWKWFRSSKQVLPQKGKEKNWRVGGGGDLLSFPK